jgi:hypothetical protein
MNEDSCFSHGKNESLNLDANGPYCTNPKLTDGAGAWGCLFGVCLSRPGHPLAYERLIVPILKVNVAGVIDFPDASVISGDPVRKELNKAPINYDDERTLRNLLPRWVTEIEFVDWLLPKAGLEQWELPIEDEDEPGSMMKTFVDGFVHDWFLRSKTLFPLTDNAMNWSAADACGEGNCLDAESAQSKAGDQSQIMLNLILSGNNNPMGQVPAFLTNWTDVTSDKTLSQMIFSGLGTSRIEPVDPAADRDGAVFKGVH